MFLDEATITVNGGRGGHGCVSWRHEKFIPMGGPDGGDGGNGGSVIIRVDENTDTLSDFASKKKFSADSGGYGSGRDRHGANGKDRILLVPPGTVLTEAESGEFIADLAHNGDEAVVARGGKGGFGNAHFKSSTRQRPDFAENGEPGTSRRIKLELKLVADVGIIGLPSVGKSTLISVISSARPKIAAYHFTTLVPNLGVATAKGRSMVICDVPGLIEGASEGKGLGDRFLRHIERCGLLIHLLDLEHALTPEGEIDTEILVNDYASIRRELVAYSPTLADKKEFAVLNKIDLVPELPKDLTRTLAKNGIKLAGAISGATKAGIDELLTKVLNEVLKERKKRTQEPESENEIPVLRPHENSIRMGDFRIERLEDGSLKILGNRLEQMTVMTDFRKEGGVRRFRDIIDRIGLSKAIERERQSGSAAVYIGTVRIDKYL